MKQTVCSRLRSDAQGKTLYLLSWLAYASAYIGRYNYSAVMGAITAENSLSLSAAAATWGIGAAAEGCGWNAVFLLWLVMAMLALLVSALLTGRWGSYLKSSEGGIS